MDGVVVTKMVGAPRQAERARVKSPVGVKRPKQLELAFPRRGGKRKGAGRKPKNGVAGVSHRPRGELKARHPAHVTMKLRSHLPVLRHHHAAEDRMVRAPHPIDLYTSAPGFDGFRERCTVRGLDVTIRPVAPAETWLLRIGWRKHGLLSVSG